MELSAADTARLIGLAQVIGGRIERDRDKALKQAAFAMQCLRSDPSLTIEALMASDHPNAMGQPHWQELRKALDEAGALVDLPGGPEQRRRNVLRLLGYLHRMNQARTWGPEARGSAHGGRRERDDRPIAPPEPSTISIGAQLASKGVVLPAQEGDAAAPAAQQPSAQSAPADALAHKKGDVLVARVVEKRGLGGVVELEDGTRVEVSILTGVKPDGTRRFKVDKVGGDGKVRTLLLS